VIGGGSGRRAGMASLLAWAALALGGCPQAAVEEPDLGVIEEADLAEPPDLAPVPDLATGPVTKVTGFDVPESAYWHAASSAWYVSNMSLTDFGKLAVKDGKGWISKLDRDGKIVEARWFETGLSTPAGIRGTATQLVVANIDELVVVDVATRAVQRIAVPGAGLLNDVDVGPDGRFYATDTLTNTVWSAQVGQAPQKVRTDAALNLPNGILALPNRLLVASTGPFDQPAVKGELWSLTLDPMALTPIGFQGKLDGIEQDGQALLVSDNASARVYRVTLGQAPQLVRDFKAEDGLKSAGDIGFDPVRRVLAVPDLQGNTVAFVPL
jgi:hypothetical protein